MKRNFDEKILDLDGMPVIVGSSVAVLLRALDSVLATLPADLKQSFTDAIAAQAGRPLTLATACSSALMGAYDDERLLDASTRIKRMELARKVHAGGIVDITPEDRDMIKPLLMKCFAGILVPVVAGELLEKDAAVKADAKEE